MWTKLELSVHERMVKMKKIAVIFLCMIVVIGFVVYGNQAADINTEFMAEYQSHNIAKQSVNTSANKKTDTGSSGVGSSVVYMTTDISSDSLMEIYEALGTELKGKKIAVKISTGEPPASNYLDPDLIKDLVQQVNGDIVECNTAYGGSRSETAMHYQVAKDHGFTDIAAVVIMDENASMTIPVEGGTHLQENYVGEHFQEYDGFLVLSHFKGHAMAGFGGAIKNISIGIASSEGKCLIHTAGRSHTSPWGGDQDDFLESMAEAGKSVVDALDGNIVFINVMNHLSIDCDCNGRPAKPDMHDIGILASTDPVALDQACVDLIYEAEGNASFVRRMEGLNAQHVLEYGEKLGLGNRSYQLISLSEQETTASPLPEQSKAPVDSEEPILEQSKAPDFVRGDINGDSRITLKDVRSVLRAVLNIDVLTAQQTQLADVNSDGQVNFQDVRLILRAALNIIVLK